MSENTATVAALPDRVDPTTLAEVRSEDRDHVLIDVRTPAEFEAEHIKGAINIPLDTLKEDPAAIAAEIDEPAVLVCRSGARASQAHEALAASGLSGHRVLEGGMVAWSQSFAGEDAQVNRGRQRWDLERQVRFVAGLLVLVGVLTSLVWPPALALSGFVGAGLVFAAVTNTCAMGMLLAKAPWNGAAEQCDLETAIGRLK